MRTLRLHRILYQIMCSLHFALTSSIVSPTSMLQVEERYETKQQHFCTGKRLGNMFLCSQEALLGSRLNVRAFITDIQDQDCCSYCGCAVGTLYVSILVALNRVVVQTSAGKVGR